MSTEWDDTKRYVEPIAAEIDQPDQILAELSITLYGNGEESMAGRFPFTDQPVSADTVAALYEWAARLLVASAKQRRDR